jgi:hypothetical protein
MLYCVCAVYDVKLEEYMAPFNLPTRGSAVRAFGDECQKDSPMKAHPDDFTLYLLASWESESGVYEQLKKPEVLARARDYWLRDDVV